ncbi:MAG: T9SS type A sorting domain-containing protein [Bacteroidota bacterium]|nr:T9SS type A sorting domain-containing protein [Bacteroidota bacterium]
MRPIIRFYPRDLDIPEREIKAPIAFPNPGDGLIQLQNTPANTTYQVIDVYGRPILQGTLGQEGILDLRSMQRGMYLLQLHHPELGGQRVIKLILN